MEDTLITQYRKHYNISTRKIGTRHVVSMHHLIFDAATEIKALNQLAAAVQIPTFDEWRTKQHDADQPSITNTP